MRTASNVITSYMGGRTGTHMLDKATVVAGLKRVGYCDKTKAIMQENTLITFDWFGKTVAVTIH